MLVLLNGGTVNDVARASGKRRHSLMLVLLNGGFPPDTDCIHPGRRHSLMLVLLNGGTQRRIFWLSARTRHSLMLVLLNGGSSTSRVSTCPRAAPLADACVTEWRHQRADVMRAARGATR